ECLQARSRARTILSEASTPARSDQREVTVVPLPPSWPEWFEPTIVQGTERADFLLAFSLVIIRSHDADHVAGRHSRPFAKPQQELREGIHIIIVVALGEHRTRVDKVFHPLVPEAKMPIRPPWLRQKYLTSFQLRLNGRCARQLPALRLHPDDPAYLFAERVEDGGTVGRIFDEDFNRLRIPRDHLFDGLARVDKRRLGLESLQDVH